MFVAEKAEWLRGWRFKPWPFSLRIKVYVLKRCRWHLTLSANSKLECMNGEMLRCDAKLLELLIHIQNSSACKQPFAILLLNASHRDFRKWGMHVIISLKTLADILGYLLSDNELVWLHLYCFCLVITHVITRSLSADKENQQQGRIPMLLEVMLWSSRDKRPITERQWLSLLAALQNISQTELC